MRVRRKLPATKLGRGGQNTQPCATCLSPELGELGVAPRGRLVRVGVMSLSHSGSCRSVGLACIAIGCPVLSTDRFCIVNYRTGAYGCCGVRCGARPLHLASRLFRLFRLLASLNYKLSRTAKAKRSQLYNDETKKRSVDKTGQPMALPRTVVGHVANSRSF